MNQETETKLAAVADEISKCVNDSSIAVRFSDAQSDKFLSTAITKALEEWRKKAPGKPTKSEKDAIAAQNRNTDAQNKYAQEVKKAAAITEKAKGIIEDATDVATNLGESLRDNKSAIDVARKSAEDRTEAIKNVSLKIVTAIGSAIKALTVKTIDETAKRLNWVQQLNDAGVKLRGGFDETFTDLSNLSKRSHDEFTKLLTSNSGMVARLNAMGLRGEKTLANMSNQIVGNYGYTAKTSDSIIKYMLDSRIKYMTEEELHSMNLSSEMDRLALNMRRSSAAFGKNAEQIIAETKAREEDYTERMIEKKYGEAYKNMKLSGLPPELIRMFFTNIPNADAIKLLATTPGFQQIWGLMQRNKRSLFNNATASDAWFKIMNDKKVVQLMDNINSGKNLPMMEIAKNTEFVKGNSQFSLMIRPNREDADSLGDNNISEINAINSLTALKTSINKLDNNLNDKLSSKLDTLSTTLKGLSFSIGGLSYLVGKTNSSLLKLAYGAGSAAGSILSDVAGSVIQLAILSKVAPYVKRYGFKKGIPLGLRSAEKYALRQGGNVIKNAPNFALTKFKSLPKFGKLLTAAGVVDIGSGIAKNFVDERENPNTYHAIDTIGSTASGMSWGSIIGGILGGISGALGGPGGAAVGAKIGMTLGGLGGLGFGINDWINAKSPAQSGVQTNNYNTSNVEYTTQRIVYTDGEKESNDKAMLATLNEINRSMNYFVNNSRFQTSPMPFGVTK